MEELDILSSAYSLDITPRSEEQLAKKFRVECAWRCVSILGSIPLILMSVFVPVPGCFYYYSLEIELQVQDFEAPHFALVTQNQFCCSQSLLFSI